MTSPSPLLYDMYYHIYNRGNNRENVFIEERNYDYFLGLYSKYIEPMAETFAFCLLKNHFHFLVRVRSEEEITKALEVSGNNKLPLQPNYPSKRFSDFFNAYAKAINKAYNRTGSLFQHPFGRVLVTNDRQFFYAVRYIHQNPQKHKFVDDFREWKWSSFRALLSEKPTHLSREMILDWFGGREEYSAMHSEWVEDANMRWFAEDDIEYFRL